MASSVATLENIPESPSILQQFQELYRNKYGIQNPPFSQLNQNTNAQKTTDTSKRNAYHRSKNNRRFEKGWLNRSEQFRR